MAGISGVDRSAVHGIDLCKATPPRHSQASFENWELDERYRQVQARVGIWHPDNAPATGRTAALSRTPAWQVHQRHEGTPKRHGEPPRLARRSPLAAKVMIWLGLAAILGGAGVMGWRKWKIVAICGPLEYPRSWPGRSFSF